MFFFFRRIDETAAAARAKELNRTKQKKREAYRRNKKGGRGGREREASEEGANATRGRFSERVMKTNDVRRRFRASLLAYHGSMSQWFVFYVIDR